MQAYSRFAIALALLIGTGWFLQARERREIVPPHPSLATFPTQVGTWTGTDIPIEKDAVEVLGSGDFLLRQYENENVEEPRAYLFVAYFPSQRTGDTMHSPRNCLPGAGWEPVQRGTLTLQFAGGAPFPANQYVIEKGLERQLVLYWYQAQGRRVASEYRAKIDLVLDAMRTNRSDGALVRLTTPLVAGETPDAAIHRLESFAGTVVPQLDAYIPK